MSIGKAIQLARRNVGFTEQDLAKKASLPLPEIKQIEGEMVIPSLKHLQKIANVLGLRISQIGIIADSINNPSNGIRMLQRKLLLAVQPVLVQG